MDTREFQELLLRHGRELYRDMPWRQDTRPYYVLVSELMLQQTQVERVIPKFEAFVAAFPDEQALASASLADVLKLWQGLGYNRRAKYLHDAAKQVAMLGEFPADGAGLLALPGVGKNTAGAILAYAYNQPSLFVETNVRTVYIHHFFADGERVSDAQITALLTQTIDQEHPRECYWSLMDYGSWLKRQGAGRNRQSKHYKKQSPLAGSVREIRGRIIALLSEADRTSEQLRAALPDDGRYEVALAGLLRDGLVTLTGTNLHLTK